MSLLVNWSKNKVKLSEVSMWLRYALLIVWVYGVYHLGWPFFLGAALMIVYGLSIDVWPPMSERSAYGSVGDRRE